MRHCPGTLVTTALVLLSTLLLADLPGQKGRKGRKDPKPEKVIWSQYYGGADHNNYRKRKDRIKRPKVLWHVPDVYGQPSVTDKSAYTGGKTLARIDLKSGRILAAVPAGGDGDQAWWSACPILTGKSVIAVRSTGSLEAWAPDLSKTLWKTDLTTHGLGGDFHFSPACADGVVVIGAGNVAAVDAATGKVLWKTNIAGGPVEMSPAIASGRVFGASRGGVVFSLDLKSGKEAWKREMQAEFGWTSPVVADGRLFLADRGGRDRRGAVNAFHAHTGKHLWTQEFGATGCSTPGVAKGVILAGFSKFVGVFDQETGKPDRAKQFRTDFNPFGSPTLVGKTLYFGNLDGHLYAFDFKGDRFKWCFSPMSEEEARAKGREGKAQVSDFVHLPDGRLLVSTTRGLFALGSDRKKCPAGFVLHFSPPPKVAAGVVADIEEGKDGWSSYTVDTGSGDKVTVHTNQENQRKWLERSWKSKSKVKITYVEKTVGGETRKVITKVKPIR